jgi:hypothetical protein
MVTASFITRVILVKIVARKGRPIVQPATGQLRKIRKEIHFNHLGCVNQ